MRSPAIVAFSRERGRSTLKHHMGDVATATVTYISYIPQHRPPRLHLEVPHPPLYSTYMFASLFPPVLLLPLSQRAQISTLNHTILTQNALLTPPQRYSQRPSHHRLTNLSSSLPKRGLQVRGELRSKTTEQRQHKWWSARPSGLDRWEQCEWILREREQFGE